MIAVLLAAYNGEKYIMEMLNSLAAQSCQEFLCYIHDDGSSDNTLNITKNWIGDKKGKYIILEGEPTGGAKENFFWLLSRVEADYYMFADQDDVWLPEKIETCYKAIQETEESKKDNRENAYPALVFSDMYVTDSNLNIISGSFLDYIKRDYRNLSWQRIIIDNPVAGCSAIINKPLRDEAISVKDIGLIEMHDKYLAVLAVLTGRISYINTPLLYYRQHGNNEKGAETEEIKDKILRNIGEVFTGNFIRKKREFHQNEMNLARALLSLNISFKPRDKFLLGRLSHIDKINKVKRIKFYKENGFNRKTHNFWFFLWV